jgi:hypothetical protein
MRVKGCPGWERERKIREAARRKILQVKSV